MFYEPLAYHGSCDLLLLFTDSLVKGAEEVTVVMPTDLQSTAEPVQPVEQLTEEPTNNQSDTEELSSKC